MAKTKAGWNVKKDGHYIVYVKSGKHGTLFGSDPDGTLKVKFGAAWPVVRVKPQDVVDIVDIDLALEA